MITGGHKIIDMKTEIKTEDVLHLYLGCDLQYKAQTVKNAGVKNHTPWSKQTSVCIGNVWTYHYEVKPILRPLSDITLEEQVAIEKIRDDNFTSPALQTYAEVTAFCLKAGLDVFGHIKSGLAVDKTKM